MNADRNLLFGVLALQLDFITREQLIAATSAWVLDKGRPIESILQEHGAIPSERHALISALVKEHLKQHDNDAEKSLASLSSIKSVRDDLNTILDSDLHASLQRIPERTTPDDPFATTAYSVGASTSDGQRFRILRPHARGGLGEVFVARDEELGREVALKQIQERHADHPESRSRFLLEAEITGGLEHPGIVPVYGLGSYADGRPYYAMRFIRGDSLKDAVERFHAADWSGRCGERELELRKLLGRFIDVCNAIEYAHSRGVLHRDLKPGNIMLGKYGETLVVDWGLAKAVGRRDLEDTSAGDESTLRSSSGSGSAPTQMGSAIGTPAFMSPEQAAGKLNELKPASDVYSLGATMYSVLTGVPPFPKDDVAEVLRKVQGGDFAKPRILDHQIPLGLERICLKAMSLRASDRYESPRKLADDIEHWLADEPISAQPDRLVQRAARWSRHHRAWTISAAAVAVSVAVVATWSAFSLARAKHLTDSRVAELRFEQAYARLPRNDAATASLYLADALQSAVAARNQDLEGSIRKHLSWWTSELHVLQSAEARFEEKDLRGISSDGRFALLSRQDGATEVWDTMNERLVGVVEASDEGFLSTVDEKTEAGLVPPAPPEVQNKPRLEDDAGRDAFEADALALLQDESIDPMQPTQPIQPVQPVQPVEPVQDWELPGLDLRNSGASFGGLEVLSEQVSSALSGPVPPPVEGVTGGQISAETAVDLGDVSQPNLISASEDGSRVMALVDHTVHIWDVAAQKELSVPINETVVGAEISRDGRLVAIIALGRNVEIWSVDPGERVEVIPAGDASAIAFDPLGGTLLVGHMSGFAEFWDIETAQPDEQSVEHGEAISFVAVLPDSDAFVTASRSVKLWNRNTLQVSGPMLHNGAVAGVSYNSRDSRIVTASLDWTAQEWDCITGTALGAPMHHAGAVLSARYDKSGLLVTDARNPREETGYATRKWKAHRNNSEAKGIANETFLVGMFGRSKSEVLVTNLVPGFPAQLFDSPVGVLVHTGSGESLPAAKLAAETIMAVDFSSEQPLGLVTHGRDARLYNLRDGAPYGRPLEGAGHIIRVLLDRNRDRMRAGHVSAPIFAQVDAVASMLLIAGHNSANIWDIATGTADKRQIVPRRLITRAVLAPSGKYAALVVGDIAQLWSLIDFTHLGTTLPHSHPIDSVTFSPDEKLFLVCGGNSIQLYSTEQCASVGTPIEVGADVASVAFSSAGDLIATLVHDSDTASSSNDPSDAGGRSAPPPPPPSFGDEGEDAPPMPKEPSAELSDVSEFRLTRWKTTVDGELNSPDQDPTDGVVPTPDRSSMEYEQSDSPAFLGHLPPADDVPVADPQFDGQEEATEMEPPQDFENTSPSNDYLQLFETRSGKALGPRIQLREAGLAVTFSADDSELLVAASSGVLHVSVPAAITEDAKDLLNRIEVATGLELQPNGVARVLSADEWAKRAAR